MDPLSSLEKKMVLGSLTALGLLLVIGVVSWLSLQRLVSSAEGIRKVQASVERLESTLSNIKDIETGTRGFLLTGDPTFLAPYQRALHQVKQDLAHLPYALFAPVNRSRFLPRLDRLIHQKLALTQHLIEVHRKEPFRQDSSLASLGAGKRLMDQIREVIFQMQTEERSLLGLHQRKNEQTIAFTTTVILGGSLLGLLSVGLAIGLIRKDMLKRRQVEAALARSEGLLKDAQQIAKIGSWEYEVATDTLTVSDALLTIFEITQGAEALKTSGQFYSYLHPQDVKPLQEDSQKCIASGQSFHTEYNLLLAAGKQKSILSYVTPLQGKDGKVRKVIGTCQDITQRKAFEEALKKSELRFRSIFRLNPFATAITRLSDGKILDVNEQALQVFGYSYEEVIAVTTLELNIWTEARQREELINRLTKERTLRAFETTFQTKQGKLWSATNWLTIIELEGESCILWIIEDSTERKRLQVEMESYAQALEKANESKDKFFSIIAHDLLSPLNGVLGSADLLSTHMERLTQAEIQTLSQGIYHSTTHLKRLLTNLLEWARMQTGGMEFNPKPVDLAQITQQVVTLLSESAQKKGLYIENTIETSTMLLADEQMLLSSIRNLLTNAIKFSKQGGRISITCQVLPTQVQVSIEDQGIGMSQQMQAKLFQLGAKQTRVGTGGEKGTGIGLLLSKEFVEKHGGQLWVESEEGKGTTFHFTLPS